MNLEDGSGNGSHWVCVFNVKAAKYFFDCYGLPPPVEVVTFLREGSYLTFQIQAIDLKCFGQLCLYVLFHLNNNGDFYGTIFNLL